MFWLRNKKKEIFATHYKLLINPYHAGYFYILPYAPRSPLHFSYIESTCQIPVLSIIVFTSRLGNNVDPDQLASEKPADLNLQCFQKQINLGSAEQGLKN